MRARGLASHGDGASAGNGRPFIVGGAGRAEHIDHFGCSSSRRRLERTSPPSTVGPDRATRASLSERRRALVKASAVVKHEPPRQSQPSPSPGVLDIELTVMLPTNPTQVTFAPNHLTVYGGVLVEQTLAPADPTKSAVLIRAHGTVARDGSLVALFGVVCAAGEGNVRVDMTFVSPLRDGDKVTIRRVDGY